MYVCYECLCTEADKQNFTELKAINSLGKICIKVSQNVWLKNFTHWNCELNELGLMYDAVCCE